MAVTLWDAHAVLPAASDSGVTLGRWLDLETQPVSSAQFTATGGWDPGDLPTARAREEVHPTASPQLGAVRLCSPPLPRASAAPGPGV